MLKDNFVFDFNQAHSSRYILKCTVLESYRTPFMEMRNKSCFKSDAHQRQMGINWFDGAEDFFC